MKSKIMFIALYSVAFMFPSIGTVDTADALADISHCANLEATAARPACEAAAHGSMGGAPAPFDDGLMGAPGMSGAAITGNDNIVCGDLSGKLLETNCLRDVLDASKHAVKKAKGQKRGNYGCGNSDRFKHTACLRAILHSSDNTFAPGTN
jgi:hypothetical protein